MARVGFRNQSADGFCGAQSAERQIRFGNAYLVTVLVAARYLCVRDCLCVQGVQLTGGRRLLAATSRIAAKTR